MNRATYLLGGALLGCSDPMDSVSLDFRATPLESDQRTEWSVARLESGHHRVTLRRAVEVASNCDDLDADLLRTAGNLMLRVRESAEPSGPTARTPCGYTAVIDEIPSGRYSLRVVHTGFGGASGAREVMNQPLVIR